jgi:hypothetical protein
MRGPMSRAQPEVIVPPRPAAHCTLLVIVLVLVKLELIVSMPAIDGPFNPPSVATPFLYVAECLIEAPPVRPETIDGDRADRTILP